MATYEIIIKNETAQAESPIANDQNDNTSDSEKDTEKKAKKVISGAMLYRTGKALVRSQIGHEISTISLRTGQTELQQRYEFANQIAESVFDVGESIAIGASVGKGWGAVIGAVIGIGSKLVGLTHKQDTYNLNTQLEQETLRRNNTRAGVAGSRREWQ